MSKPVEFSRESFAGLCATIGKSGATYTIGKALLSCCYFSIVENDAGPANQLVESLRKSTKQQAIIDLLQEQANLIFTKTDPTNPGGKDLKNAKFFVFDNMHVWHEDDVKELRTICANWEDYKGVKADKGYDLVQAVEAILKTADSRVKNGKPCKNAKLADTLRVALSTYTAQTALEAGMALQ